MFAAMPDPVPQPRLLVTAGPTWEPVDAVRYIGNKSSGTMGTAIACSGVARGWDVTLLLGPVHPPVPAGLSVHRFENTQELQELLNTHWPAHDILVMAAAVADFRPADGRLDGKRSRSEDWQLELEATPDLLSDLAKHSRPGQVRIGFALEEPGQLEQHAREKLARKSLHGIVGNPLSTMESETIDGTLFLVDGSMEAAPPGLAKPAFASWLLDRVAPLHSPGITETTPSHGLDADA